MSLLLNFVAEYGERLIDNGYSIIPIAPRSKVPSRYSDGQWTPFAGWNRFQAKPVEPVVRAQWARWPNCGIGIMCGAPEAGRDGVVGIDIDVVDDEAARRCATIVTQHLGETACIRIGLAPKLLMVYRTREVFAKLTRAPLEALGVGQQFVGYGIHEKTEMPYGWPMESLVDTPIDRLPLVTCEQVHAAMDAAYESLPPALRQAALKRVDRVGAADCQAWKTAEEGLRGDPEAVAECARRMRNDDLDWNAWNERGMAFFGASGGERWGLDLFDEFSRRSSKYRRDGKDTPMKRWASYAKSGIRKWGFGALYHWAREADDTPFPCNLTFNEQKKAAAEMDLTGVTAGHDTDQSASDAETGGTVQTDHSHGIVQNSAVRNPYDWDAPDPNYLGTGRSAAPEFPIEVLGPYWSEWVKNEASAASAPRAYVACSLLSAAGLLIGNSRWAQATFSWREPPVLWMGLVGSPSSGKSPAMSAVTRLVEDIERRAQKAASPALKEYKTEVAFADAKYKAWQKAVASAVKASTELPARPDDTYPPDPPSVPKLIVTDVTPESLLDNVQRQPRGIVALRDELAGLLGSFDRYAKGSGERAMWIEAYGGRRYTVDRKTSAPIVVPHLTVGILGCIQPDRLREVVETPDDGLVSRFLWCWPDPLPTVRLLDHDPLGFTAGMALQRLYDLKMADGDGELKPVPIAMTAEARDMLEKYAQNLHARSLTAVGHYAGALGKARGHVLRLSLIIECLHWCVHEGEESQTISAEAVARAITLMDNFFLPMAGRCHSEASIPVVDSLAMVLAKALKRKGKLVFNSSKLRYEERMLRDAKKMDQACETLIAAGWIRVATAPRKAGRRLKDYEVNPLMFADGSGQIGQFGQ